MDFFKANVLAVKSWNLETIQVLQKKLIEASANGLMTWQRFAEEATVTPRWVKWQGSYCDPP